MNETGDDALLFCPLSSWFWRRLWLAVALFGGLALFFCYDGAFGYPKTNFHADLFDAFEAGKAGQPLDLPKPESDEILAAFRAGEKGESWAAFAASRHLGEARPDRHTPDDIDQQFVFGGVFGGIALLLGAYGLAIRKRGFEAGPDWLRAPGGKRAAFAEIESADTARWNRGITRFLLADRTIKLDDYKYEGADGILDRIRKARPDLNLPRSEAESNE